MLREAQAQRVEVVLFTGPVVASGRVELLTFLREQAISATNHRYGNPLPHALDLTGGQGWERGPAPHPGVIAAARAGDAAARA